MARKIDPTSDEAAWAWVALAASTDDDSPGLWNVEVSGAGRLLAATDRHRLHIAVLEEAVALPDGVYDAQTHWPIPTKFPGWRQVLVSALAVDRKDHVITYDEEFRVVCEALGKAVKKSKGQVGFASVPGIDGLSHEAVTLNPRYVVEALGAAEPTYAGLYAGGQFDPVILADSNWRRVAVVMPVRAVGSFAAYPLDGMLTATSGPRAELPQPLRDSEPLSVVEAAARA